MKNNRGAMILSLIFLGLIMFCLWSCIVDKEDDSWKTKTYSQMTQDDINKIAREARREFYGY